MRCPSNATRSRARRCSAKAGRTASRAVRCAVKRTSSWHGSGATPRHSTSDDAFPARSGGRSDARGVHRGARRRSRADGRAAVRVADEDAEREAEGCRVVGVRVRITAVESTLSIRRIATRVGARTAPALLPAVARVARHATRTGPRARTRSRRIVPRCGVSVAGTAGDGRVPPAVAPRDGHRRVLAALVARRLRRTPADRAGIRRAA